jgi:hypothetical protein
LKRCLSLSLLFLLVVPSARANDWFTRATLRVPGTPRTILVHDLNGDGRPDLAVVYAVSRQRELLFYVHLAAYLQTPKGFRSEPDAVIPLSDGQSAIFLAEADGSHPGLDLVTLGPAGISSWSVTREKGRALWHEKHLGAVPDGWLAPDWSGVRQIDLATDLDGDGRDEILVPGRDELVLLAQGPDGRYTPRDRLHASVFREIGQPDDPGHIIDFFDRYGAKVSETFPEIHAVDVNGDGRLDLLLTYDDLAATYLQHPDGHFDVEPRLFRAGGAPNVDLLRAAVPPKVVTIRPYDFDSDGRADLLFSRSEVHGLKGIVTIDLHRNGKSGFERKPSFHLRKEALGLWPIVSDFDRDGKPDFTYLQTEFGLREIVRFLLTRRVTFHYDFYTWRGSPPFPAHPVKRKDVSVKFDLKEAHLSAFPLVDVEQDFNGDGIPDFYAIRERDAFSVYFGKPRTEGGFFSGDPDLQVHVHQSFYHRFADLNGDRRADVVFWYQSEGLRPDLGDKIVLLTSRPLASPR